MDKNSKKDLEMETDIFILFKKFKESIDYLGLLVYRFIRFIFRNKFVFLGLLIIGVGSGYLIDNFSRPNYKHEIIVTANFNSVDYLYKKLEAFDFKDYPIKKAEIEPITDLYAFIKSRYQNLELAKYMSDNSIKFEKYQPNQNIENFHRYHLITIYSNEKDNNGSIVDNFLDIFNHDNYYLERQKIEKGTIDNLIKEYEQSIENINEILSNLGIDEVNESNVNVTTYPELYQLVNVKKSLIDDINKYKIEQFEQSKIVFDTSRITNIVVNKIKYIILMPTLLIFLFLFFTFLKSKYRMYMLKDSEYNS